MCHAGFSSQPNTTAGHFIPMGTFDRADYSRWVEEDSLNFILLLLIAFLTEMIEIFNLISKIISI